MTLLSTYILESSGGLAKGFATTLDSVSDTALDTPGVVRYDVHPVLGVRGFQYMRCFQSGGDAAGELMSFLSPVSIANIASGTTTSITTTGLTANLYNGALLRCIDDAGGAGAAPEGETARILKNSTTVVTVDPDDAFSAAPAVNDDFMVVVPWAVQDSASGDEAGQVCGVSMATKTQYQWGWYQFLGKHPTVNAVAAGTAIPAGESVIAGTALVTDGAGATIDQRIGFHPVVLSSDTVVRKTMVDLYCGVAFKMGTSTV